MTVYTAVGPVPVTLEAMIFWREIHQAALVGAACHSDAQPGCLERAGTLRGLAPAIPLLHRTIP